MINIDWCDNLHRYIKCELTLIHFWDKIAVISGVKTSVAHFTFCNIKSL